jgi:hypothetical protein
MGMFDKPSRPYIAKPAARPKPRPGQRREDAPGRLDRDRFAGLPLAKTIRVKDEAALATARDRSVCELCCVRAGPGVRIEAAHVQSRGAGGGDSPENLLSLCAGFKSNHCHHKCHTGEIPREKVIDLLKRLGRIITRARVMSGMTARDIELERQP